MHTLTFSEALQITKGQVLSAHDGEITTLIIDSRKAMASPSTVFFAISGPRHNGHNYISSLYAIGLRQFIVEEDIDILLYPGAGFIKVASSLRALQEIVAAHRRQFSLPVIGVTGSNAKTILKEWLYQLLSPDFNAIKNPGSYNSQTGVPLSVWPMNSHHELGIFEAGISQPGEMEHLGKIIRPTIGIFTNIGSAHEEGFESTTQKISEKLKLFDKSSVLIFCEDHDLLRQEIHRNGFGKQLSWGRRSEADVRILKTSGSKYALNWRGETFAMEFPFADAASIENAMHCVAVMLQLHYTPDVIQERISQLKKIPMRLELKQGIDGCQIIDDTYNNDLAGLQISLDFLGGIQHKKSTVILSDILQSGLASENLVRRIAELLTHANVGRLLAVGPVLKQYSHVIPIGVNAFFFESTQDLLQQLNEIRFSNEVILIKGARAFHFENIVQRLQRKIHGTVMEIDLGSMVHNLNFFRAGLKPGVKLMAMVKAFAYGSGSEEVASLLQYHGIDWLGVAYPDEGISLRKNSIRLPIMVMNPAEDSYDSLIMHDLQPEIFSISMLKSFASFLNGRTHQIHVKLDTGMHRLGLEEKNIDDAISILSAHTNINVASVFSHLAGADEPEHDAFTTDQINRFVFLADKIKSALNIDPILHILNSSGILRFPQYQLGMVRLGIGLYGVDPTSSGVTALEPVATLKTVVSQIKIVKAGETIGYGRKGKANKDTAIGTIAIGYADGFSRAFSKGVGSVLVNGKEAPVIGNVCMDMTMVDLSGIDAREGDEAIVFGKGMPISQIANRINTIPYEILTSTSDRVKRVFFAESI